MKYAIRIIGFAILAAAGILALANFPVLLLGALVLGYFLAFIGVGVWAIVEWGKEIMSWFERG